MPSYRAKTGADHSPTDTALPPIGIATKSGIAWTTPGDEITLQVHLRFWKKDPQSEGLHTHTNPLELTVLITFDPSYPELNHGIVCRNNPVLYTDPSGHFFEPFSWAAIIGAVAGAISSGIQSDWNPGAMAIGAGIGWASGGLASGVATATTGHLLGSVVETYTGQVVSTFGIGGANIAGAAAGGAAGGMLAGGLSSAIYGGNVLEGMGYGALGGGILGGAMGAIGYYGRGLQSNAYQYNDPAYDSLYIGPTASLQPTSRLVVAWNYAAEYGTTGQGLQPSMTDIEGTVDAVSNRIADRDAIVTYTTNGAHSANSRHYTGEAVDLRTRDLSAQQRTQMTQELRRELGNNYRVINEGDHIHIQTTAPRPTR